MYKRQPEDNKTSSIRDELAKKVNQVSLVTVGKKEPSAFVTLTNELAKAKEVLNNNEASEDALKDALNKLDVYKRQCLMKLITYRIRKAK